MSISAFHSRLRDLPPLPAIIRGWHCPTRPLSQKPLNSPHASMHQITIMLVVTVVEDEALSLRCQCCSSRLSSIPRLMSIQVWHLCTQTLTLMLVNSPLKATAREKSVKHIADYPLPFICVIAIRMRAVS
jgi:hypothetical protein